MGRKRDTTERYLGPYFHHGRWRLLHVGPAGGKTALEPTYETREEGVKGRLKLEGKLSSIIRTTETARKSFVEELQRDERSERTIEGYEWAISKFWPAEVPLSSINPKTLAETYKSLRDSLSVDSHRNALKMAKTFLRFCVGEGWIQKMDLDEVKGKGDRNPGKDQLLIDESSTFYNHCLVKAKDGDMGAVAALLCHLSMRSVREALSVTARQIDDGGRVLQVLRSKTKTSKRGIPVPRDMQPILLKLKEGKGPEDPIFTGRQDRKWVWDQVKRLCAEAGVPRVCPHALRGGLATSLSVHGVPHEVIQAIMGHELGSKVTDAAYIDKAQVEEAQVERRFKMIKGGK